MVEQLRGAGLALLVGQPGLGGLGAQVGSLHLGLGIGAAVSDEDALANAFLNVGFLPHIVGIGCYESSYRANES